MSRMLFVVAALAATLFVSGCAKEPATEIEAARAALQEASAAEAAQYAPEALAEAQQKMEELETELQTQSKKFALTRNYDAAKQLAAAVSSEGTQTAAEARTNKKQVMDEATVALQEAKASLEAAMTEIANAPTGKGTEVDIEVMKQDLMNIQATLPEIEAALSAEKYIEARAKATAAKTGAENVRAAILAAIEAKKAGR